MEPRDFGRTVLLCAVGGSADAIAYLRYGTFVGAMSGNTVLLGIDLAELHIERAGYHASIIAVFVAAVVANRAAVKRGMPVSLALVLTALMLGGSDFIASPWSAAICAAALGMQNAAVRSIGGVTINTAFITGDLLRLGVSVPDAAQPKQHAVVAMLATAWIAYACGAVVGAVALHLIGHPMFVPAVLALAAAAIELRAARRHER
jgi:uncharacterized membrane protein YoaK (UPF0700 family)